VPTALYDLLQGGDPEKVDRAMKAVLASFGKPDLAEIQRAAAGG
jgi:hypothetical protein